MTSTQYFNALQQFAYRANAYGINTLTELNSVQNNRLIDSVGLWNDISNFNGLVGVDNADLARRSANLITVEEKFLGVTYNTYTYWDNSLPNDWTRVLVGNIPDSNTLGVNISYGNGGRYHEVYIDTSNEGLATFQLGSRANYTLIHEIGHSIVGGHLTGNRTQTIMAISESNSSSAWYASTPMSLDIDQAAALYGVNTTTRLGNDTYGFNATFSGAYRAAFDFGVNTRPLVTIFDNGGIDTLDASGFVDAFGGSRSVSVDLTAGASSNIIGGQTFAVIYRTSVIENAIGGGGNDQIRGNSSNNSIRGGAGDDFLMGFGGSDTIDGGVGTDTAAYIATHTSYRFSNNLDGSVRISGFGSGATDGEDTLTNVEFFSFQDGRFDLVDLGLDDFRAGYGTNSVLNIGGSVSGSIATMGDHDWFKTNLEIGRTYRFDLSGAGANAGTLRDGLLSLRDQFGLIASDDDGGPGLDPSLTFTANATNAYFIDVGAFSASDLGSYVLQTWVNNPLSDIADVFSGSADNDWIQGLNGADRLSGLGGDDVLDGGAGDDWLEGNSGADRLVGGSGIDTASYEHSVGGVSINLLSQSASGGDAQGDTLLEVENLVGSAYADILVGDTGSNTLRGGLGADILSGGSGEDTADYSDSLIGVAVAINGNGYFGAAEGDQLIDIENIIGSSFNDTLSGDGSNNRIEGGLSGNDTLLGGGGDDIIVGSAGNDLLIGDLDFMGSAGAGADQLFGEQGDDRLFGQGGNDILWGGLGNDSLAGEDGDDHLYGEAGNDVLNGGAGADFLYGGTGDDTYVITDSLDVFIETSDADSGFDTVISAIDTNLPINIESLILYDAAVVGIGNASNNYITGNARDNILVGAGGSDAFFGAAGNDTYFIDDSGDFVAENVNEGLRDIIYSEGNYTLPSNVEVLVLVGGALTGIGNTGNNEIFGNSLSNFIDGGSGADVMFGGAGDDTYFVDSSADFVLENDGEGFRDIIYASANYTLTTNVEVLVLTGSALTGVGNSLSNEIYGNDQANILLGAGGSDAFFGGGGNDTYILDSSDDFVLETSGQGSRDIVYSSANFTLPNEVEVLVLTGSAVTAVGNAANNEIYGNAQNNTIIGGQGDDVMFGGVGADTYIFLSGFGHDVIADFALGQDKVAFSRSQFADFGAVQARAKQIGGDVLIVYNELDSVVLQNVSKESLGSSDFILL